MAASQNSAESFPGVLGHFELSQRLSRALGRDRLHHALVFEGQRGIGRKSFARGFACALLCEQEPTRGCGRCSTCLRILKNRHRDLSYLLGRGSSQTIAAEDARSFALEIMRAPFESHAHLAIIDPADRMHPAAAAALLKTIEEPPPGVYFALIVQNSRDLLDTLRSRSISLPFPPLSNSIVEQVVEIQLKRDQRDRDEDKNRDKDEEKDRSPLNPEQKELAIQLAGGRPGVALEMLTDPSLDALRKLLETSIQSAYEGPPAIFAGDQSPLWTTWREVIVSLPVPKQSSNDDDGTEDEVIQVKGSTKKSVKGRKAKKKSSKKTSSAKESPAQQRELLRRLSDLWILHLRNRLGGAPGVVDDSNRKQSSLTKELRCIQEFQRALPRNPNARLLFEQTLLQLSAQKAL